MTTASTLAAELAAIRADLAELRRYVRTKPEHVVQGVREACGRLYYADNGTTSGQLVRVRENLAAGLRSILLCPGALDGYLAGADWELACLIGRLKREATT